MNSKTFLSISKEECLIVYKDILENSDKKWNLAKSLASSNDYGSAISMSIISIEELIKSIILLLDGKGFEFRKIKGINLFFKNHEIRFVLAYVLFVISIGFEELFKFIDRLKDKPIKIKSLTSEMKLDREAFFKKHSFYLFRKLILLKKEMVWFSKIEIYRQEGFYSDYDNDLKCPQKISQSEFTSVVERLEKVRRIGKKIIEGFETNDYESQKQLIELQNQAKNEGYYLAISKGFEAMRKANKKPFEMFKSQFD